MPHILLVEDEADLSMALAVRLRAAGFTCETAGNGQQALERLAHRRPDVLVADLLMPVMDGYTLIRHLRADSQLAAIPMIVVTAVPEYVRAQRADDLRGVRVIQKPFDSERLIGAVKELMSSTRTREDGHG